MSAKATIDAAYTRLDRATESSSEASRLLLQALDAATEGEKGHRRMGARWTDGRASYKVQTAARYFVCKWFADPGKVGSALDACRLRDDCLRASALRQLLDSEGKSVDMSGIAELDYSTDLVGER
jgi:hypothetical protein